MRRASTASTPPIIIAISRGRIPAGPMRWSGGCCANRPAACSISAAGRGLFCCGCAKRGWNAVGFEQGAEIAGRSSEQHGLTVHVGTLPDSRWPDACFDAITMRQSLEHVHAPLETLRDACRLLTVGGQLLVSVPNFDALAARWFGPHWHGLDLPRHLTHFTPPTLHAMLAAAGFTDIAIQHESHPGWIRHSAKKSGKRPLLATRLASGIASRWARFLGRGESLLAFAVKE